MTIGDHREDWRSAVNHEYHARRDHVLVLNAIMRVLNRYAVVVRYRQPFVDWVNRVERGTGGEFGETLADEINDDPTVYLIDDLDSQEDIAHRLDELKEEIFESALHDWYVDPKLWPEDRSIETCDLWLKLEVCSMVIDTETSRLKTERFED